MSTVPAVIDAVVTLFDGVLDIEVMDGPTLGEEYPSEFLCVGLAEDGPGYESERIREPGMGRARFRENFTINCLLCLSTGDSDGISGLRSTATAALEDLDGALRDAEDPAWVDAQIAGLMRWGPLLGPEGAQLVVLFQVQGWAWS